MSALLLALAAALPARQTAPAAWAVESIATPKEIAPEIGALDFAVDGALLVGSRRGLVWRVDLATGAWKVFAEGLHEVTGLVHGATPGEVFACDRPSLVRLRDLDGDLVADEYTSLCEEWGLSGNYHEYAFGPVPAGDGGFFVGLGCASDAAGIFARTRGPVSKEGRVGRMYSAVPWRGWVVKVAADGTMTPWAKGFREPNGMARSPDGDLFVTDNQGDWLGTSALYRVERGRFYGHPSSLVWDPGFRGDPLALPVAELDGMREKPVVQFPHNRCCNSPTQPAFFPEQGPFATFRGQFVVGDIPAARLLRVALEQVDGTWQGAVIPFLERGGLRTGSNRLVFAPDGGSLWLGQGSRGWAEGEGLQRVVATGHAAPEILALRARPDGFELEFTRPLDPASIADPATISLQHYRYAYHRPYGSPELDVTVVPVAAATPAPDGTRLRLVLPALVPDRIYELTLGTAAAPARTAAGEPLAHPTAWYTLHRIPAAGR